MLNIEVMPPAAIDALLAGVGYGHLGCADADGQPYVVPMHYAYDGSDIYFLTSDGVKSCILHENPAVCLQVEVVNSPTNWSSVMVRGQAELLTEAADTEHAMQLLVKNNPTLMPALHYTPASASEQPQPLMLCVRPTLKEGRYSVVAEFSAFQPKAA